MQIPLHLVARATKLVELIGLVGFAVKAAKDVVRPTKASIELSKKEISAMRLALMNAADHLARRPECSEDRKICQELANRLNQAYAKLG